MSDAYTGEIRLFGGNYAPENWHICDGTLLTISQYPALYALIGLVYGGNGTTSFALPDLRGRVPVGQGQGAGLTNRVIGQNGGTSTVTLTNATMPPHTHDFYVSQKSATSQTPANGGVGLGVTPSLPTGQVAAYAPAASVTASEQVIMGNAIQSSTNFGGPHLNLMPYLAINYIICLNGIFPDLHS